MKYPEDIVFNFDIKKYDGTKNYESIAGYPASIFRVLQVTHFESSS